MSVGVVNEINSLFIKPRSGWYAADTAENFYRQLQYGPVELPSGTATLVDSHDGDSESEYEENIWFVFSFDGAVYRVDGTYSSWSGSVYTTLPYVVEGREVTKIEYIRPKK